MSSVIAETIEIIKEKSPNPLEEIWIEDLVIGIFFTGVKLSTGHGGCAFTPVGEMPEAVCCPTSAARMPSAGHLEGKSVSEMINYALDPNVLKSAIGIATLNGLSQSIVESGNERAYEVVKGRDGFDLLDIQSHETVSLVGAFGPYIKRLKSMGNPFYIIEKNRQTLRPDEMKHFKPESEMKTAIEKSQVVIITGTAIVNQWETSGHYGPHRKPHSGCLFEKGGECDGWRANSELRSDAQDSETGRVCLPSP